jgi:ribosomal-protein-alanine N-acetyltransferase
MTAGFPTLRTSRLVLREFTPTDAPAVFEIFSYEGVTRYHNVDTMTSLDQAEKIVSARMALFPNQWGVRWAITWIEDADKVIGSCGLYMANKEFRSAEIGFELHPDYWRLGLMSEALTAALNFGYSDSFFFELNRVQALTSLDNIASINLLKKLGFHPEGILRDCGYWDHRFHDLRMHSILRREWLNHHVMQTRDD